MAGSEGEEIVEEYQQGYDAAVEQSDAELLEQLARGFLDVERTVGEALHHDCR